jgi:hypothetical protein
MHGYREAQTSYNIALPAGRYLAIIVDRYVGPKTALTIALPEASN